MGHYFFFYTRMYSFVRIPATSCITSRRRCGIRSTGRTQGCSSRINEIFVQSLSSAGRESSHGMESRRNMQ